MYSKDPIVSKRRVPKALQESFIDPEMIYATGISIVLHGVIFLAVGGFIWEHYGAGYRALLKELHKHPDIIIRLQEFKAN